VEKARGEAAAAQDFADSREAGQFAPAPYQEGQKIYGLGMDALKNQRFNVALERFTQSAGAFIEAASEAGRNRAGEMTRSQAAAMLQQARELAAKRRIPEAEKSYVLFLQQFPQDAKVSVEYGMLLMNNGAYVRGMQHLRKTLQLPGLLPAQRAQIHARFAEAYHQTGQIDFALVEITEAIRTEPSNPSYQKMLAQLQREAAQRRQAQPQRPPGAAPLNPIQDLTGSVLDRFLK
jgi:Tfp pilus assembly protein PilF